MRTAATAPRRRPDRLEWAAGTGRATAAGLLAVVICVTAVVPGPAAWSATGGPPPDSATGGPPPDSATGGPPPDSATGGPPPDSATGGPSLSAWAPGPGDVVPGFLDGTPGSALAWLGGGYPDQTASGGAPGDARQAAERTQFSGTLLVQWSDEQGTHSVPLAVTGTGGVVQIDGRESVVATPDTRLLRQAASWSLVASGDPSVWGAPPPITAKYTTTSITGPDVAGRPTTLVEVWTRQGQIDEQLYVDVETGLVLRREQFDPGGPVRVVGFTAIRIGSGHPGRTPAVRTDDRPRQMRPADLPAPFVAPVRLDAGYLLVGILRRQNIVQVMYSDGLHSLSVFEQAGTLDSAALPRAGQHVLVGAARGIRYGWSGGQVVTWQRGPASVTVVGDGPLGDVLAAADSVPAPRRLSVAQTLRLTSRRLLVEMWRPG